MKIYSNGREATVTFITSTGVVFTVGHFYRGEPVLVENRIPVKTITVAKIMDYYLGVAPIKSRATIVITSLDYNMQIMIKGNVTKYGRVLRPLNTFFWLTNIPVTSGESGAPVLDMQGRIIGYVTHASPNGSIIRSFNETMLRSIQAASEKAKVINPPEEEEYNEGEQQQQEEYIDEKRAL